MTRMVQFTYMFVCNYIWMYKYIYNLCIVHIYVFVYMVYSSCTTRLRPRKWCVMMYCVCLMVSKCFHISSLIAQSFDCGAFMNKFSERFLRDVDSRVISSRLEIKKVISEDVAFLIKGCSRSKGNEELFLHLQKHADQDSIPKLCHVMTNKDGYPNMILLGQDMNKDLDLLTSRCIHVNMYLHTCPLSMSCTYSTTGIVVNIYIVYTYVLGAYTPTSKCIIMCMFCLAKQDYSPSTHCTL